jgi:hypothetical protein
VNALPNVTYLLPIRRHAVPPGDDLPAYLTGIATIVGDVIVVDGSEAAVFSAHGAAWGNAVRHVTVDAAAHGANGKAAGVRTGMALVTTEYVIVADDDVRYGYAELAAVRDALANADIVRPQNYFDPLPWHAVLDEGRSLIARATGGDWPGTLGIRHAAYVRAGAYDAGVLFENLELVRTVRAAGGTERLRDDIFVARRPPAFAHFAGQRVRQAYDEFARPARLAVQLALAPAAAILIGRTGPGGAFALAALASAIAEIGRRRAGGNRYFSPCASLLASLWVAERAITSWLALAARLSGGIPYAGSRLRIASTPPRVLQRHVREAHA